MVRFRLHQGWPSELWYALAGEPHALPIDQASTRCAQQQEAHGRLPTTQQTVRGGAGPCLADGRQLGVAALVPVGIQHPEPHTQRMQCLGGAWLIGATPVQVE